MQFEYCIDLKHKGKVSIDIKEINCSFIQLFLQNDNIRYTNEISLGLIVKEAKYTINHLLENIDEGILITIPVGDGVREINIEYKIPQYVEIGARSKKIVKLANDCFYGCLRYILFEPIEAEVDKYKLYVMWPQNWCGVKDCWNNVDELGDILNTVIVGGKNIEVYKYDNIYISMSQREDNQQPRLINIYNGIKYLEKILKIPLNRKKNIFINVLEDKEIHGGISVGYSILSEMDMYILFHELVHIWIGNIIKFGKKSNWIKEGMAEYLSIKVLYNMGVIDGKSICGYFKERFDVIDVKGRCYNLVDNSSRLIKGSYLLDVYSIVYNVGMMVAMYVDACLIKSGKCIEEIIHTLYENKRIVETETYLGVIEKNISREKFEEIKCMIYGEVSIPEWTVLKKCLRKYVLVDS